MKNLKLLALSAIAAASITVGLANAAQWDPTAIITQFNVTHGTANALDTDLKYRDSSFLDIVQTRADINGSLDGQFKLVSVDAPEGITVKENADANGQVYSLERGRKSETLQIGLEIAAPDNAVAGQYPVMVTLQNVETGTVRTVEMIVNVQ